MNDKECMDIILDSSSSTVVRAIKRDFCFVLIFFHLASIFPSQVWAESVSVRKSDLIIPDYLLPDAGRILQQPPLAVADTSRQKLERMKGEFEIPDHIPAETEILLDLDIEGPQSVDLNLPPDAVQQLSQLTPVERQAARGLLDSTAQASWQHYLGWFGGVAPTRLHLVLIQSNGRDMGVDDTSLQFITEGYGQKGELLGKVVFKLGVDLVESGGDDSTSRDYENFQESERKKREFTARWERALLPPFNPLNWVRLRHDDEGNLIEVVPGPSARAIYDEVVGEIMGAFAQEQGRGPGGVPLGLLQIFKNMPREDLLCAAVGIGSMALFTLAGKLVAWLATRVIIGIIGTVFIAPLIRLFGEVSTLVLAATTATSGIRTIVAELVALLTHDRRYAGALQYLSRRGIAHDMHSRLLDYESAVYRTLAKKKLRYMKIIFLLQSPTIAWIGWAASAISGAIGAYVVWKDCKERQWFPARARALAGMEFALVDRDNAWTWVSNVVAAADQDHITRVVFNTVEEMEPFLSRNPIISTASLGMGARGRFDMGTYAANYANTIESSRDLVAEAGRYEFGFCCGIGGYEGWGYATHPQRITLLLNMVPLEVNLRSDLDPGSWGTGWIPFDRYYPAGSEGCDVTWQPGRERGWCELVIAVERDWETPPLDPHPNVILRYEFPTVRM